MIVVRIPFGYRPMWWRIPEREPQAMVVTGPTAYAPEHRPSVEQIVQLYETTGKGGIKTVWPPEFYVVVGSHEKAKAQAAVNEQLKRTVDNVMRKCELKDYDLYVTYRHGTSLYEDSIVNELPERNVVPENGWGGMYSVVAIEPDMKLGLGPIPVINTETVEKMLTIG